MNEYKFVTPCRHEGTIKPVKSAGKHAGKWFCRVKGPKVDALGMNVKTLYTAPFTHLSGKDENTPSSLRSLST